ncbi:MAG TPA: PQQ-binding-like beta-propeller repeat protein [Verrucomicrobiae bacterium]|nr:PQQ-binding-like beta-propeller repeat protein [Verrucomicrobiae bacterium]
MKSLRAGCFGLLCILPGALAGDWPQWRGPDRTGQVPHSERIPSALPAEPKILWRIKIGEGLASPVVAGGKVFHLDTQQGMETLHVLDAANAKELWHADIDRTFFDQQSAPGPRCAPLVDGDRVYAQSCRGELRCLKVADGSPLWHVNYTKDFSAIIIGEKGNSVGAARHGNNGSPVIDGDKLFAAVGGTNGEGVVCFEKITGKVIWKSQDDPASYAAPIVATIKGVKQLVDFTVDGLIGLDVRDGKILWRVPLKTSSGRHVTTPVVVADMVLVASHEIGLVGVKLSQNGKDWQATKAWVKKESAINFSSPVVVGNYLYGLGPAKNIICVDVKTGAQTWSKPGYIAGAASNAHAGFIVMGGNILTLTDGGQLVLFAVDPKEFKEIGNVQVCGKTWCNPAYADGKLFLRDGRELFCADLLP